MKKSILMVMLAFSLIPQAIYASSMPLVVHPNNSRYFASNGEVVYLTGAHNWHVLINIEGNVDYIEYLNYMKDNNHNFLRLWANLGTVWNRSGKYMEKVKYREPTIYQRTGPGEATDGNPKFDLTVFNPEYTKKLKKLIEAASELNIYVSIMLFEGWWNSNNSFREDAWYGHPFNPLNNVNDTSVIPSDLYTMKLPKIVALQENYVRHVIDAVNGYNNIMYEIINEAKLSTDEWQNHLMNLIKNYEKTKQFQHPVWITSKSWGTNDDWLWKSNAEAVSPSRLSHWNDPQEPYLVNPPVTNGRKVVILDTDHFLDNKNKIDWRKFVWKSFLRGYNPIIMDPYKFHDSWVLEPIIISTAGYTKQYAEKINLAKMLPSSKESLCSTTYCLRNPNQEYLIYQPTGRTFSLDLGEGGNYAYEWFDPVSGTIKKSGVNSFRKGINYFSVPLSIKNDSILYLIKN